MELEPQIQQEDTRTDYEIGLDEGRAHSSTRIKELEARIAELTKDAEPLKRAVTNRCPKCIALSCLCDGACSNPPAPKAITAEPMDLGLARAMCRSAGISLVSRDFIERFADFVMDWKKGDFTLPKYAELDMQSCFDAWQAFDPDLAADTRWIPVGERLPEKGRVPVLVAVSFIKHAEHEDGTQYVIEGVDVTEGEYVPKHGESDGYMESYQGRHGDASHVTHWMPLPNPPIAAAVNAFNGVKP